MNPSSRVNLGLLLLAITALSLAGAFVWVRLAFPSDGARQELMTHVWDAEGIVVTPLFEEPNGLRRGDVVTAVEGRELEAWINMLFDPRSARPNLKFGQPLRYTVLRDSRQLDVFVSPGAYPFAAALQAHWGLLFYVLANLSVAAFVFFRRPYDAAPRLLLLVGVGIAASSMIQIIGQEVGDIVGGLGFWFYHLAWSSLTFLAFSALLHLALVFPKPAPIILGRPLIIPIIYAAPFAIYAVYLSVQWFAVSNPLEWLAAWQTALNIVLIAYLVLALVVFGIGYHRERKNPITRQQLFLVLFSVILLGGSDLVFVHLPEGLIGRPLLDVNLVALVGVLVPVSLAFAIMRYHLFDIDVLLNRALVYSGLTLSIVAIYVVVVGSLGALFQTAGGSNLIVSLVATALVAALFQPLRERLQRGVNRLMYGERDEPYTVLTRLGQRLEATLAPNEVLPTLVETVAQALKLPYAAIALGTNDPRQPTEGSDSVSITAAYGQPTNALERFPLRYQHEIIGELIVARRGGDETLSSADKNLLETIADQVAVAAHAVRLTSALQQSRERLVTAREEERRRIRRDLHDGLGPALASITLKLDATRNLLPPNADASAQLLKELKTQTQSAIADIRRLVYDLRPPALDELGLVGALGEYASRSRSDELDISLDVAEPLPPLSAAVEVAAYRIATEALTNVQRHSHARHCRVSLVVNGDLQVEIQDDGAGLPETFHAGVGLTSMRERAAELGGTCVIENAAGGGTRVVAQLPMARDL